MQSRTRGTPQGGVASPILANLFLHYACDMWGSKMRPGVRFCRYADDGVVHCKRKVQAELVLRRIGERLPQYGLALHPHKTHIACCQSVNRCENHPVVPFTFLGHAFRPRKVVDKDSRVYVNLAPTASRETLNALEQISRWICVD